MDKQLQLIAERMKALRDIAGVSASDLALELHVPIDLYERYENGDIEVPVSMLYQVANRFGVELVEILTGEKPRLHTYCLVRKGKGVKVDRRKAYDYQHLAFNFIHKKAEPFLVTIDAPAANEPIALNAHEGQEFNYLISGSMKVVVGDHELILNEGDSLFFDAGVEHGMQALSNSPAQFLAIIV